MTKTLSKAIAAFSLGALVLLAGACQKEAEKPQLGSLKAAFGSDEYSVEPGGTISLAFVVSGHENADVAVSAKASSDRASVEVKNPLMYQGEVLFTAPAVSAGETVTVTLTAVDEANSRKVEATTAVKVGASEALEIAFSSEYKSMACRPGGSFAIPFAIKGVGLAKISSPQLAVTPSSWGGKCELASDGLSGKIVLTAPSALTESVKVELSVKDDYSREAKATLDIAIAAVTETAGASNSYIVKPGSTLTIKAVEGNSADKVDFDNAKLLWQTELGMVKSVSAAPGEGALVVSLNPGLSGNAVVAALKDGVIVWSWHLWVCDYNPDADPFVWKSAAGNTFTFMDRNLGALSSEKYSDKALGYMYQYGRKDPFVCADGVHSSALIKMYDMDGQRVYDDAKERPVYDDRTSTNLQLAINNPMTFYSAPQSAWPVVDWLTNKADLQGNDLWGGKSHIKTKYDPCPEGWMVPETGEAWGFRKEYSKAGGLTTDGKYDPSYPWYIEYEDAYCIGFRYKQADGKEYWFPFNGDRNPNTGVFERVDSGASIWTSTASNTTMTMQVFAWGNPAAESYLNRSYGAAIRCIKVK